MSCNKEMIKMIEVLNKLQDKLVSLGVTDLVKELPQIAVVGSQSAGKSSVLESFVGRDFLPRGGDIVTRRPLILQLKQNNENSETFAKFNHSSKIFTDFDEIRREIQYETDRTVPNSGISSDPINLMISSPDVLDLNLIDLPGMTKIPIGDQPENIETIVTDLIKGFISNENCLILAVTPANQDLSTSDAIKLSREVDPNGDRTIGVLTKLDLMDKGTDASVILLNQHKIKLKRGFIGVKCRSPQDIKNNKELSEAIAEEKAFFAEHSAYRDIGHRLGIEYLQKYLQNELANHIFSELPSLRQKFREKLDNLCESIEKISIDKFKEMNSNELISNTTNQFSQNFRNEIGTGDDVPVDHRNYGTIINVEMNVKFAKKLESIVYDENRIEKEIRFAIVNIFGTHIELFVPNKAFKVVVQKQLELMRRPSLNCVDNVYNKLEVIVVNKSSKDIEMFPILNEMYVNTTLEYLRESKKKCKEMVDHKLDTEKGYISATNFDSVKSIQYYYKADWINYDLNKYYFVLQNRKLTWFSDENKSAPKDSVNLIGINEYICGEKTLVLIRNNNSFRMELEFDSKAQLIEWVGAIYDNAYQEHTVKEKKLQKEESEDSDPVNDKYPINIDSQVQEVKKYVLDYIKIIEESLKDYIPKLCQKELVDSTEKFVRDTLRNRIQNKGLKIDKLMDRDPNKEERLNLLKRQTLYEEALKAMDEVMQSSNFKIPTKRSAKVHSNDNSMKNKLKQ